MVGQPGRPTATKSSMSSILETLRTDPVKPLQKGSKYSKIFITINAPMPRVKLWTSKIKNSDTVSKSPSPATSIYYDIYCTSHRLERIDGVACRNYLLAIKEDSQACILPGLRPRMLHLAITQITRHPARKSLTSQTYSHRVTHMRHRKCSTVIAQFMVR